MPERASAAALAAANINPRTGLATDYLNHFNEAIMLLEMIPAMPDCADEFYAWQPLSYRDHFMASHFRARDLAVSAYEAADADLRSRFDHVTGAMTSILTALHEAMRKAEHDATRIRLAEEGLHWLKPLVALAGTIINGTEPAADVAAEQADIDHIMNY